MTLSLLTSRQIALAEREVPAITPVKDEIALLPHFLGHHRRLGVRTFFFVDNGSADGSLEFLLQQPDCHVFSTSDSFRAARYGMDWVTEIATDHCMGKWFLFADCDELLVYRNCETVPLADFAASLGARSFDAVAAAMIDMYPDGDFLGASLRPGRDIFEVFPNFDADYVFRPWPRRPWDAKPQQFQLQVLGGPRTRLLSDLAREARRGAFHYTLCNQIDRIVDRVPLSFVPVLARVWPKEMPAQHKVPLNFVQPGFAFSTNHSSSNAALADETAALLHLKLCDELRRKVSEAALKADHYRRGLSYEQLRQALAAWRSPSLRYPGTRRFSSSRDLEAVGLIGPLVARLWTEPGTTRVATPA